MYRTFQRKQVNSDQNLLDLILVLGSTFIANVLILYSEYYKKIAVQTALMSVLP